MRQPPGFFTALRLAGLLVIGIFGLVSIIATAGGDGGRKTESSPNEERSLNYPGIDEQYRKDADLGKDTSIYYRDADGDSYGDPNDYASFETQPIGYYVTQGNDCDDTNYDIHPKADEICGDGLDNNCDGLIDADCAYTCTDADSDGYFAQSECKGKPDCNDASAAVNPGVEERCWDGVDNNCNSQVDEEDCVFAGMDEDEDGYYADTVNTAFLDCDDADADINPGAVDLCGDGIDSNCDGQIDERCPRLPDTGLVACFDDAGQANRCPEKGYAFYGQDATYTINPPSYTKLDADGNELPDNERSWVMVRDNVTGLIWENKVYDGENGIHCVNKRFNWFDATDEFIAQINTAQFGGYSDWRLPSKIELINLTKFGTFSPAISTFFSYLQSANYWSSTNNVCDSYHAWQIDFKFGIDSSTRKSVWNFVIAVRGEPSSPVFFDNDDGTVTDQTTGLMWMKTTADVNEDGVVDFDDAVTWQQALSWCEKSSLLGYSDWRLPTIKELDSIVDYSVADPAVNTLYFPDTISAEYWSSTSSYAYNIKGQAWGAGFTCGENVNGNKANSYYIRAVRGGQ